MASNDRLSVLPKELLDEIYSLVFPSENGPWTVHVQAKPQPLDRDERELGSLSVLAMPRDDRYHSRRQRHPSEFWPDDVERAFMRGRSKLTSGPYSAPSADCVTASSGLGFSNQNPSSDRGDGRDNLRAHRRPPLPKEGLIPSSSTEDMGARYGNGI